MFGTEHQALASAVVAVGMSAGALPVLRLLLRDLRPDLPAAIVIAHHVAAPSVLPALIERWRPGVARFAASGMPLCTGGVYVCPAAHHIAINPDATLVVSARERVSSVRPSVDWFFESAAASFGERAIAVVLSGANRDGARGVRHIRRAGGTVLVQDPTTAQHPQMPLAARARTEPGLHPCELGRAVERALAAIPPQAALLDWEDPFGHAAIE